MENKKVKFRYGNDFDTQSNTSPGAIYFDFKKKQIWADSPTEENHTLFTLNKLSELEGDANHNTVSDVEKAHWNQKADGSTVEELASNVSYIDEEDNETIISDIESAKKQLKDYIDVELTEAKENGEFDGKSAHQYAVEGGYDGTEEQFSTDLATSLDFKNEINNHNISDTSHQDIRNLISGISVSSIGAAPEIHQHQMAEITDLENALDDYVTKDEVESFADKIYNTQIVLSTSAWNENTLTQTVNINGILADEKAQIITATPHPLSLEAAIDCMVLCYQQGENTLIFKCEDIPTKAIHMNISWQKAFWAEPETSLISFSIDGTTYEGMNNMTWAAWVQSKYNTGNYSIIDGYLSDGERQFELNSVAQEENFFIEENGEYVVCMKEIIYYLEDGEVAGEDTIRPFIAHTGDTFESLQGINLHLSMDENYVYLVRTPVYDYALYTDLGDVKPTDQIKEGQIYRCSYPGLQTGKTLKDVISFNILDELTGISTTYYAISEDTFTLLVERNPQFTFEALGDDRPIYFEGRLLYSNELRDPSEQEQFVDGATYYISAT